MTNKERRSLDLFFAQQRERLAEKLNEREERLKHRLKSRGMDRASRQALTLIIPNNEGWQQTHHYSGMKKPDLGYIEQNAEETQP